MKMKIAMLLALIILCACTAASAQEYYTLPEIREQAAAGWHETYTDKYGRETTVDIDVQVFGEDKAPVLKVGFPAEYLRYEKDENPPYQTITDASQKYGGKSRYIYEQVNGSKMDLDRVYGEEYGNEITLREAYEIFEKDLVKRGISSKNYLFEQPMEFKVICSLKEATEEIVAPAFYIVNLWTEMYELPIMAHARSSFVKGEWWPAYVPYVGLDIRNEESYSIYDMSLVEQELLSEDIPLCSVAEVIRNIEEMIEAGYIQEVYSLRFGYSVYNDPTLKESRRPVSAYDADCYYLLPSWILECRFMRNPKKISDDRPQWTITINAQTGEMLDPFDKSKKGYGNPDYKGFIPWDKVQ